MHPVKLIANSITQHPDRPELPCEPTPGVCAITGSEGLCVPRKKLLGKSFTNGDLLARPDSDMVSIDAYYALKFKWERMNSWFCDGATFERLTRQDVRRKVFQPEMPPQWAAYATTSYKKHGALNAHINTGAQRIWLFETRLVDCSDRERVDAWWQRLNQSLRAGIGRSVLESLDCPPYVIGKVGLSAWLEFEAWARDKYLSALYAFLCYLLPSQEELKHEAQT
jgi:hypothetical protein